jgi:hypothetical protein
VERGQAPGAHGPLPRHHLGEENMTKCDTYNYTLRDGRKVVYHGISNDPDRRFIEHDNSRKRFTSMIVDSHPCSHDTALYRERERIEIHQHNHHGKRPRYNRT